MNIFNFRSTFSDNALLYGKRFFDDKRIIEINDDNNGIRGFVVRDWTEHYDVVIHIENDGEIKGASCTCKKKSCRHIAAALMMLELEYNPNASLTNSNNANKLISLYARNAEEYSEAQVNSSQPVHIIPELYISYNSLCYNLKIGRDKMYIVKSISELNDLFKYNGTKKYGKYFEFRHSYNAIDAKSRSLIELSTLIYTSDYDRFSSVRDFTLKGNHIDSFFRLYKDDKVIFENTPCLVKYDDPDLCMTLKKTPSGRYTLSKSLSFTFFGSGDRACIFNSEENIFYICSTEYTHNLAPLLQAMYMTRLFINADEMPAFYTSILLPISNHMKINGMELLDDIRPPEMCAKLYLDCSRSGDVIGRLEFVYDDKVYNMTYTKSKNPFCNYYNEAVCSNLIKQYFDVADSRKKDPLVISDDDRLYTLITKGLPELSQHMEIFTTDRFNNKAVLRPAARTTVGVRPTGSVLELEITAEGYSAAELAELLSAYRQGRKYHRLKDGSFAAVTESISELNDLTRKLNISDKALLKQQLKVPYFRMLYLNELHNANENIRIERSNEFKKLVRKYNNSLNNPDDIEAPESVDKIMREYQVYGYKWMKTIADYGFGGILADDMGLGKTLQAIALILDAKQNNTKQITSLVICPSSLTLNWESEISKFAPSLKTLTIIGTAAERRKKLAEIKEYDVIITSYSLIARDFAEYEQYEFYYQFIDEAQYIKNNATQMSKAVKTIRSHCRFALTGTPVENSLAELWSIFDFIMPDYLYSYQYFKKNFETPIVKEESKKSTDALQKLVSPFILRRLKSDVLKELPEKIETVLLTDMDEEQSKVYSANVSAVRTAVSSSENSSTDKIKILAMLTRLRQLCCDPSLVYENYSGGSAKLEQCMELISSCISAGHKILLFSQFTSMLEIIKARLDEAQISSYVLTGATKPARRIQLVNSFNSDDTRVFLISLKAGGTGLNLTGADIVIHYDPWWNISAENQASDRAYRIGQKKNVQIYKMITRHTIEENIRKLQLSKSELADIVLGSSQSENNIMHMTSEDILRLLE